MSNDAKRGWRSVLGALTLLTSLGAAADGARELQGAWWQWALSIPGPVNPLNDATGQACMVGQRGDTWFLGGTFGGGAASRSCSVPQGVKLFFPVANSINFDAPGVCGQGASISVADLRSAAAGFIDGLTQVEARLDGRALRSVRRIRSQVFAVALPGDNLFAPFCGATPVPAAIYPRAVDDGYYGEIEHLGLGQHTLQLGASGPGGFSINVVYTLTVVARDQP